MFTLNDYFYFFNIKKCVNGVYLYDRFYWITRAIQKYCSASKFYVFCQTFHVWLGGLLNPEAYITATRQCIAQANSWSLEELVLDVTITDGGDFSKAALDDCSFAVVGKGIFL